MTTRPFDWRSRIQNARELQQMTDEELDVARHYWTFQHKKGWAVIGYRANRWWVADGFYADAKLADLVAEDANLDTRYSANFERDWFNIGMWTMPTEARLADAIKEACTRLDNRYR